MDWLKLCIVYFISSMLLGSIVATGHFGITMINLQTAINCSQFKPTITKTSNITTTLCACATDKDEDYCKLEEVCCKATNTYPRERVHNLCKRRKAWKDKVANYARKPKIYRYKSNTGRETALINIRTELVEMEFKQPLGTLIDKFTKSRELGTVLNIVHNVPFKTKSYFYKGTTSIQKTVVKQILKSVLGFDADGFEVAGEIKKLFDSKFGSVEWVSEESGKGKEQGKGREKQFEVRRTYDIPGFSIIKRYATLDVLENFEQEYEGIIKVKAQRESNSPAPGSVIEEYIKQLKPIEQIPGWKVNVRLGVTFKAPGKLTANLGLKSYFHMECFKWNGTKCV